MPEPLKLGLITDVHYGADSPTKARSAGLRLLDRALVHLSDASPDLIIDLGDRINDENEDLDEKRLREVAALFDTLKTPRQHLLGNHDVAHTPIEVSEQILEAPLCHRIVDLKGWRLLFWCADVSYEPYEGGLELTDADLSWLDHALGDPADLPVAIFTHVPLDDGSMVGNYHFEHDPH